MFVIIIFCNISFHHFCKFIYRKLVSIEIIIEIIIVFNRKCECYVETNLKTLIKCTVNQMISSLKHIRPTAAVKISL